MSYIKFESSSVKEIERKERKLARETILAKAKAKYNSQKITKEKEKWMHESVEERIKAELKKEKKRKLKKKKAKRKKSSSSDSSDDNVEDDEWVEKVVEKESDQRTKKTHNIQAKQEGLSVAERDEWMTLPGLFPCVTREKSKQNSRDEAEKQKNKYMLDRLGKTDRELNPYWKDGGTGLPQEGHVEKQNKEPTLPQKAVGDHGVDWLRRALKRAKEQAVEEGRTLEEVAAERWGSLQKLETMLAEAEKKSRQESDNRRYKGNSGQERDRRDRDKRYDIYSDKDRDRKRSEYHDERKKSCSNTYEKQDSREKFKNYTSSHSNRDFQKPKDESDMQKAFCKPEELTLYANSYKTASSSGNWRKKLPSNEAQKTTPKIQEAPCRKISSSSSDSEVEESKPKEQTLSSSILSDKEMNDLGAKLVKAEILGNKELAKELRSKLEAARKARTLKPATNVEEEVVVLTRRDSKGFVHPLQQADISGRPHKKQKVETHKDGSRIRYFADDDRYSLKDLFEREKLSTVEDQNEMFIKLAGKASQSDMDDIFLEKVQLKKSSSKLQAKEKSIAIREHKKVDRVLSNCNWCFDSKEMLKHLIVAIGTKVYLCLPPHQSLTEGHCFIVPMFHVPCSTQLDEDVWQEIQTFKKPLVQLFKEKGEDVIFFETATYLKKFPHMLIECVPLAKEIGDMAPVYFKKAILECETEWSTNKKLVDLRGKDVRRAVPKELPYFAVDFGLDPGYAHVVEDEKIFPKNFAQEIIGGMLDLDHRIWRKQRKENFDTQRKKVMQFAEWWKPYDFTVKNSSDSD